MCVRSVSVCVCVCGGVVCRVGEACGGDGACACVCVCVGKVCDDVVVSRWE